MVPVLLQENRKKGKHHRKPGFYEHRCNIKYSICRNKKNFLKIKTIRAI